MVTKKLTKSSIRMNAFKKINKNAIINLPKEKLKQYRKIFHRVGFKKVQIK